MLQDKFALGQIAWSDSFIGHARRPTLCYKSDQRPKVTYLGIYTCKTRVAFP
jgi:hypothetical protein